jgi:bifunctional non-homologous end joining protein LigD
VPRSPCRFLLGIWERDSVKKKWRLKRLGSGELVYRGRVGTGFGEGSLQDLHRKLAPLCGGQPALAHAPSATEARAVHWVRPELVAEVSFSGFTQDGLLRHSTFLGLREDKAASEVVLEEAGYNCRL